MVRRLAVATIAFGLACLCAPRALAQADPGTTRVSASVTGVHPIASDLDRGGDVEWSSGMFSAA